MRSLTPNTGDLVQREHPPKLGWDIGCDNVHLLIYVWYREISQAARYAQLHTSHDVSQSYK